MNLKVLGGILLVIGTSIGGGMLALPIASAGEGFIASTVLLVLCWLAMMLPALLILEVNLWLPPNTNLISMARTTLGKSGAIIAWVTYLVLLYCLISAYISSGTDVLHNLLSLIKVNIPLWASSCIFVLVFGYIVYLGIQSVDYLNRGLMSVKLLAFVLLISLAIPVVHIPYLTAGGEPKALLDSVMLMITSYGFATIVPSLRSYFHDDVIKLRKVILIGSFIPFVCYMLWNLVIIGNLPRVGQNGLEPMLQSQSSTSDLVNALMHVLHNPWITNLAHLFVSICVLTSFLAVSLGLTDFLADGLNVPKRGKGNAIIYSLTFLPPLLIVLIKPGIFIKGLSYAGSCCVILLMLLPVLMAWRGRYHLNLAKGYQVSGGRLLLVLLGLVSLAVFGIGVAQI
jgi:tyrosine-specific transport protein